MGKTVTNILLVAAAIAVNVIPGVGQALSAAIGATLATAVVSAVTLAGLQSGFSLLGFGPSGPKPETTETAIKTPRPPRVSAYGRSRLYGAYVLFETASNGTAVDVYAVHDGELDAIETHYIGDEVVALAGSTVGTGADGRYQGGAVHLYSTDGSTPGAGLPAVTALLPGIWGAGHRGDGVVALALTAASVKSKDFQKTYPASSVPVPSIVARWQKCPDAGHATPWDESGWTWTENPWRQLLHYKMAREGPRSSLPRGDPGYAADILALRLAWWNYRIAPTLALWQTAIADANSAIALKAGGTEPRYRSTVVHKHIDDNKAVVGALLSTCDGWLAPRADGALVVYSGAYYAPTVSIGPAEILSYSWDGGAVDDDQAVNEIICSYVSAEHDFNTVECDAWRDETDIGARGRILSAPLEAQVPSNGQARRLAKRRMARTNAPNRGTVSTNIAGRAARGERFANLLLEEAGTTFFSGPVEITGLTRNLTGGVTFSWVAADPNVDNWNPATEEGERAATGARVPVDPLAAPTVTSIDVDFTTESGTGVEGARLNIVGDGPTRDDLTWFVRWRLVGETSWVEREYADADAGTPVLLNTEFVPLNSNIEVEIAYQVGDGRVSPWSITETVSTAYFVLTTATMLPPEITFTRAGVAKRIDVSGVLVEESANVARFDYDAVTHVSRGMLIEPAGTNLFLRSHEFDNASWVKGGATVTADTVIAPDGTTTADKLVEDGSTGNHIVLQAPVLVATTRYTVSIYAKQAGRPRLFIYEGSSTGATATFDLSTGAVVGTGGGGGPTAAITDVGGGWYRCEMRFTAGASAAANILVGLVRAGQSGVDAYTGDGASGAYLWGAQEEAAAASTSYVATAVATATRPADAAALTIPADVSSLLFTFDDATTQAVGVAPGAYTIPTNLNRPRIKRVAGS